MNDLHGIEFTEQEKDLLERVGTENEDLAICSIFDHRNNADISYNQKDGVVTVQKDGKEVKQTVEMITDVCESSDPLDRIAVGVSMLEVSINFERQWKESITQSNFTNVKTGRL
jgi:hypothetical protein